MVFSFVVVFPLGFDASVSFSFSVSGSTGGVVCVACPSGRGDVWGPDNGHSLLERNVIC